VTEYSSWKEAGLLKMDKGVGGGNFTEHLRGGGGCRKKRRKEGSANRRGSEQ